MRSLSNATHGPDAVVVLRKNCATLPTRLDVLNAVCRLDVPGDLSMMTDARVRCALIALPATIPDPGVGGTCIFICTATVTNHRSGWFSIGNQHGSFGLPDRLIGYRVYG